MIKKHLGKKQVWMVGACLLLAGGMLSAEPFDVQALDVGSVTTVPIGDYREVSTVGFGINSQVHLGTAENAGLQAIGDFSAVYNVTTEAEAGLWDFAPAAGAAFYMPVGEDWFVGGQGGYGLKVHLATGEWDSGVSGPKWYSDQFFYMAAEAGWTLEDFGTLYLRPRYELFIEEAAAGHVFKTDIGYRFSLGGND